MAQFRKLIALAVPLCLLAACGSSAKHASEAASHSPAHVTLRFGDQFETIKDLLAWSGEDRGLPYTIDWSQFVGGPPMLQAFDAGAVDLGYVADTPIIYAQADGVRIHAVAGWESAHGAITLDSAPGVKLSGWASLKGKRIAYQAGTVGEAVLLDGLQSVGLTLKDIDGVNLPTTDITSALETKSVAGAVFGQPQSESYLAANPTATLVEVGNNITARADMLIASDDAIANPAKAAAIRNFIGRLQKAYRWLDTHRSTYARDLYVDQYKVPLAAGEKIVAGEGAHTFFALPGPLAAPQQVLADLYLGAGQIPKKVDTSEEWSTAFNGTVPRR